MTIFDLLFIALVLASLVVLVSAATSALLGRRRTAGRILRRWAACAILYAAIVAVVSLAEPRRVLHVGEAWCNDDWCMTVEGVKRTGAASQTFYTVDLRISSRARRVAMAENGVVVYLSDDRGNRYDPIVDDTQIPLDVRLNPQESFTTARSFAVPAGAPIAGMVIAHEGFPIDWFIIGEGPFRKPPIVRLGE